MIFDPDTIDSAEARTRNDLPGGASRLFADARGIGHVLVNGVGIVQDGVETGAVPGAVLRSGRNTDPVSATSRLHV